MLTKIRERAEEALLREEALRQIEAARTTGGTGSCSSVAPTADDEETALACTVDEQVDLNTNPTD